MVIFQPAMFVSLRVSPHFGSDDLTHLQGKSLHFWGELTNILLKINGTRRCISYRTSPFFGGEMLNFRGVGIWLMPAFWCWGYWLLIPASTCVLEFDAASWHTLRLSYVLCGTGGFIELLRLSQAGQGANFASQSEGHSPVWESLATKLDLMWWDRVFFWLICVSDTTTLINEWCQNICWFLWYWNDSAVYDSHSLGDRRIFSRLCQ